MSSVSPCRTYIVYRNALFAQGVHSVLAHESSVEIVGMETDVTRAANAVRALHPEVILLEEPMESDVLWPFGEWARASRIVTFSLNHDYATVYSGRRRPATDPSALAKAIQGAGEREEPQGARSDSGGAVASTAKACTADEGGHQDKIDPVSRPKASRARKARNQKPFRRRK